MHEHASSFSRVQIWMCGGRLFVLPCSRVGHIVKHNTDNHTEVFWALTRNNLRLVHVWLDEYKVKDESLTWGDERGAQWGLPWGCAGHGLSGCQVVFFARSSGNEPRPFHRPSTHRALVSVSSFCAATPAPNFFFSCLGKRKILRKQSVKARSL